MINHTQLCLPPLPSPPPLLLQQLDLGFHRYNIQQTLPEAFAAHKPTSAAAARHRSTAGELFTTQVGTTVVRSLPVDDSSGYVDVPESSPTDPPSNRGSVSDDVLLAYSGQGSGTSGATQPPQQAMGGGNSRSGNSSSNTTNSDRELLNAHFYPSIPSGDAAHNAAHCEPTLGDWLEHGDDDEAAPQMMMKPADAVSPDEPLDAIHAMGTTSHAAGSGPVGGAAAAGGGAARDDSALQGDHQHQQQQHQQSSSSQQASKPADDPEGIKAAVRYEALLHGDQGRKQEQ